LPPGGAKSTYASHCLPSWFLGHFPDNNVILASHTATLAEKWSRRVRDTVASPEHTRVFEHSTLSKDSTSVSKWSTSKNGEFLAAGVGMSILGFRADLAVLDDPVSGWEQAQSATQLEKIHNWFKADLKSRLKPSAKIIVICQRTAAYDMAGYVMKEYAENPTRRLRTIVLPMLAGEDDPLGRAPGERLWPQWYTPEMVADLQKDEFIWKTMWQQEPPSDDGSWVTADDIKLVDTVPDSLSRYLVSDLALSVNKGDYSVHATVGVATNGSVYVTDMWRERTSVDVTVAKHLELVDMYNPLESLIDDDNASKVYVQLLANQARERGIPVPWKTMPMRGQDKETRAAPLRGMFKRGMIFFKRAPWNRWIVNELLIFPNAIGSGVDDGVDALSLIGRRLSSLARPAGEAPVQKPPPTVQEMTLAQLFEDNELKRGSRRRL
ncbi:MAG: phage terminase large subunit, partial [Burkholderiaceae bacterium]